VHVLLPEGVCDKLAKLAEDDRRKQVVFCRILIEKALTGKN
jgi:hypothetical protein